MCIGGRFSNHQKPLAILRQKVRECLEFKGKTKELKKAGATRMGSHTFVGERLEELKGCLQATVVDPRYTAENYADKNDEREISNCGVSLREHKGGTAKRLVLEDHGFWQRVRSFVKLTKPICMLLRRHDSSAPSVGKVYHGWYECGESIGAQEGPYAAAALKKHEERWLYAHCPFFAAAYVLDPEFIDHDQASSEEVMKGFVETLEKIAILLKVRKMEEEGKAFKDIWAQRATAIAADPTKLLQDYPAYPTPSDADVKQFCSAAHGQLSQYRGKKGLFGRPWLLESAKNLPAYMWWDQSGSCVPELQIVARMVLAQPASASICERINSEFGFIHDRRRNRLFHEKANKLVSLFHNLRLLKRMQQVDYTEPAVAWTDNLERSAVTIHKPSDAFGSTSCLVKQD